MSVTKEIIKYLKVRPNPTDKELHDWAEENSFDVHEVEEIIYRLASRYVRHKDHIPGGRADSKKPEDYDAEQLKMGTKVEMEHTDNPKIAKEIAMDHLEEIPDYYTRLDKMEKEAGVDHHEAESAHPGGDETLPSTDMSIDKAFKGTDKTYPGRDNMKKLSPVSDDEQMIKTSLALTKEGIHNIITKEGIIVAGTKVYKGKFDERKILKAIMDVVKKDLKYVKDINVGSTLETIIEFEKTGTDRFNIESH